MNFKVIKKYPTRFYKQIKANLGYYSCFSICAFGFSGQMFLLTYSFAKFGVEYDERFEFPLEMTVPDVMICSVFYHILKLDLFAKENSGNFDDICPLQKDFKSCITDSQIMDQFERRFVSSLDMDEISRYLYASENFILKIEYGYQQDNQYKVDCFASDHIMYPESCFTIQCRNDSQPVSIPRGINGLSFFNEIMKVRLNSSKIFRHGQVRVFIMHPVPELATPKMTGIIAKPHHNGVAKYQIKYRRLFVERLPPPYESSCRNFSAAHHVDQCLNKYCIEKYNTPCPSRYISPKVYRGKGYKLRPVSMINGTTIFASCYLEMPQECQSVSYDTHLQNADHFDDKQSEEIQLDIMTPFDHDIVMFASPKIPITSYLIMCGSIMGTWFGVSVFNVLVSLKQFVKRSRMRRGAGLASRRFLGAYQKEASFYHPELPNYSNRMFAKTSRSFWKHLDDK